MTPSPRPDPVSAKGEVRRLLGLAWPVMLTSLNWTILHVTDVIVVGRVGEHEVAALSASRSLTYIAIVTGLAWLSGVLVRASRADGGGSARDRPGVARRHGAGADAGRGRDADPGAGRGKPARRDRRRTRAGRTGRAGRGGHGAGLSVPDGDDRRQLLSGGDQPPAPGDDGQSVDPADQCSARLGAGGGRAGPARAGAVGAALATVIASAIGAVAMVASAMRLPRGGQRGVRRLDRAAWTPTLAGAASLARFGFVPAIASGLELAGFAILIALSTRLGDATAHGFQIVFSLHNVTFALAIGLGSAAGVRRAMRWARARRERRCRAPCWRSPWSC